MIYAVFFFFSSRRRHTRSDRDWSSDVCSSDLTPPRFSTARKSMSRGRTCCWWRPWSSRVRSEEHTSELQSRSDLVCRLLLEKKNKKIIAIPLTKKKKKKIKT